MHIQCENTDEFIKLMHALEYLHDLRGSKALDTDKHPIINDFMHLYLGEKDLPNKSQFVSIKGRKTLPPRDAYRPCPCGKGIDTDNDGNCPACAPKVSSRKKF